MKFRVLTILIPFLIIGCATTTQDAEYLKNWEIVQSAIREGKPKPVITPATAVISDTIRRK